MKAEEEACSVDLYWPDWSLSDQTDRSIRMPKVRILVRRLPRVIRAAWRPVTDCRRCVGARGSGGTAP